MQATRCNWVGKDPVYRDYHDNVWGKPVSDSKQLFAKLCLDGQQAGLSWITILKKQSNYEKAFFDFQPKKIAELTAEDVEKLMQNTGIVRNKLKINSIIKNANAYLRMEEEGESFSEFIWSFVGGSVQLNSWQSMQQMPTSTLVSENMSKALKKRGFSFVGSTICYAFMQAVGLVNDHTAACCCYRGGETKAQRALGF
jgi:DNA-3-methyladenine glycosylase I